MEVGKERFGEVNGRHVYLFKLKNETGMQVEFMNYGCTITKILVPDMHGRFENVVLGFDTLEEYQRFSPYFGAVVGRVAGRIKNGEFELDGQRYKLPQNENDNHLHGGNKGFSHVLWDAEIVERENEVGITFTYTSPDREEGYPGTLEMKVTYLLNNQNEFSIIYDGICDQTTLLNVTNHSYFNLSGNLKQDILDHILTVKSNQYLELDSALLPTGQVLDVSGTPFDFRKGKRILGGIHSSHPQNVLAGKGYDHPFFLDVNSQREISLVDEHSGRELIIETDQPCVVLYTGNQLENDFPIRGITAKKYLGVCLETQGAPDAIHHSQFPSVLLEKGKPHHSETRYLFMTAK